jgi:hypothetical protein
MRKREELKQLIKDLKHEPRKADPKKNDRTTPMYLQRINEKKGTKNAYNNNGNKSVGANKRKSRNVIPRSAQSYNVTENSRSRATRNPVINHTSEKMAHARSLNLMSKSSESKFIQPTKLSEDWNSLRRINRERKEDETGIKRKPGVVGMLMEAKNGSINEFEDYKILREKVRQIGKPAILYHYRERSIQKGGDSHR